MKLRWTIALALAVSVALFVQSQSGAQDKKDKVPEKKKAEPAKPIVVESELINVDLKDKVYSQSFCKSFTFKMEKGKAYQIEMSSFNFQSLVRLENAAGTQLATAMDPFGNRSAILFYEATKTEDHQIIATTPGGGVTGKFTLTIKDATNVKVLAVKDKLDANDKAYAKAGNKKHKLFEVKLEAGRTYQIDMTSGNFDSYLFLESPDGKALAQDDDGGGYPSAKIIHKATETGKFRIITTHFGGGGNLGEFNLTVRQTDGPVPPNNRRLVDGAIPEKKE